MSDRKKPNWLHWTTAVLLLLPVLYVASYGPANWVANWLHYRDSWPASAQWLFEAIYFPLDRLSDATPDSFGKVMDWYDELVSPDPPRALQTGPAAYAHPSAIPTPQNLPSKRVHLPGREILTFESPEHF